MNTILFWDQKNAKAHTIKVTQSKQAIWRGDGVTLREANRYAKRMGWVRITSRTKLGEMLGKGAG